MQYKREPLRDEEAQALADACRTPREKLIVFTLLDTGLRVSEFSRITERDIDWQAHVVRVKGKGGPFGARSKVRVVPLSSRAAAVLEGWLAVNGSVGFGDRVVQRTVRLLAARAGLKRPCVPHTLRHTFAVSCLKKRMSLPAISRLLGHEHLTTTQIYLNLFPADVIAEFRARW